MIIYHSDRQNMRAYDFCNVFPVFCLFGPQYCRSRSCWKSIETLVFIICQPSWCFSRWMFDLPEAVICQTLCHQCFPGWRLKKLHPPKLDSLWMISFWDGFFSGAMLNFRGVLIAMSHAQFSIGLRAFVSQAGPTGFQEEAWPKSSNLHWRHPPGQKAIFLPQCISLFWANQHRNWRETETQEIAGNSHCQS